MADADSLARSAVVGLSAFPHAPPHAGADDYFDGRPGPVLRDLGNGTGDQQDPGPPKRHHEGDRGRLRASSLRRTARGRYDAGAVGHSVGGKVADDTILRECCRADTPLVSFVVHIEKPTDNK